MNNRIKNLTIKEGIKLILIFLIIYKCLGILFAGIYTLFALSKVIYPRNKKFELSRNKSS